MSGFYNGSYGALVGSGFLLAIGGAIGINIFNYSTHKDIIKINDKKPNQNPNLVNDKIFENEIEIKYSKNSIKRIISYGCLVSGMGIVMMPICVIFPNAVLPAFLASSSIFAGSTLWAMNSNIGELSEFEGVLYGGLSGLAAMSLMGLCYNLFFGFNWFSDLTHVISLYGGIPLFTGLIAYDTDKAIEMYNLNDPDHLRCFTELLLDF